MIADRVNIADYAVRSWLHQTLTLDHKIYWPQENVARAKFYLSQVLRTKGEGDSTEAMQLEEEALESLRNLLTTDRSEAVVQYLRKTRPRYDLLFDYLVPSLYHKLMALSLETRFCWRLGTRGCTQMLKRWLIYIFCMTWTLI